ncbi:MAG: hypothetical protein DHS20C14_04170 [Phycisphaeraceae bacterium]|nr:MAG: hypothetical protein DHS20C14_04170 [Phycisphaeraceae bacterium]
MHVRLVRNGLVIACLLGMPANAAVIDFDGVASGTFLDDEFLALGIDFGGSMQVLGSTLAVSGPNEAFGPPFGPDPTRIDAATDEFVSLGAWFRGHSAGNTLTIEAFDAGDASLGSVSFSPPDTGLTHDYLEINQSHTGGATFAYVHISIDSVGYSMDDLEFVVLPAPASVAPILGVLLVGGRRRRD